MTSLMQEQRRACDAHLALDVHDDRVINATGFGHLTS
jgi:hypothetical protein